MVSGIRSQSPIVATDAEHTAITRVEQLIERSTRQPLRLVGADGDEVELPASLTQVFEQAAHALSGNHAVSIVPTEKELTTQQAADILNVSRPYLVQLLDSGQIPFSKTGTHRRIRLDDVLAYKERKKSERRASLSELTRLSQESGLYDIVNN
jgi:excisionase family DNA binding protein